MSRSAGMCLPQSRIVSTSGLAMRRVVSLLLIPLLLAVQGLGFAHSHGGTRVAETAGHAARPHVHVRGAEHRHPHGHRHGHSHKHSHGKDGSSHHHHQSGHEADKGSAVGLIPQCNHDDDAVYLPEVVSVRANRLSASDIGMMQGLDASPVWSFTGHDALRLAVASAYCQPPPLSLSGGPLYLRTLSLRL